MDTFFSIIVLIFSVVIHEVSHGAMANRLGDPTARLQGRLTLNPIPHLDLFGSILIPGLLILSGTGFVFGWAKPVPFNPYSLRHGKWGEALVAFAGPASNILIAIVFGLIARFHGFFVPIQVLPIIITIVIINISLAVFNLFPVPPLDGSKILAVFAPDHYYQKIQLFFSRYWLILIFIFIFFAGRIISPIILFLFRLLTGLF